MKMVTVEEGTFNSSSEEKSVMEGDSEAQQRQNKQVAWQLGFKMQQEWKG